MRLEIGLNRTQHGTYFVRHCIIEAADFDPVAEAPVEQAHGEPGTRS